MSKRGLLTAGALALATFVCAVPARADVMFTPFVGANVGGSATSSPLADFVGSASRTTFGGSIALMSGGVFGIEADVGYTPRFFGTDVELGGIPISLARNNVLTAMVNLTAGVPLQGGGVGIRPYAVGGVGLIRQQLSAAAGLVRYDANDLGYDIGGGVVLFVSRNVGIRGDVRHFRSIGANGVIDLIDLQPGAFNYTRATVGVTFRY
jgi:Outer membrane protein beta-barrel domain